MDFDIDEILNLEWDEEEKTVIERILKHFKSWKRMIPGHLEKDIVYIVKLAVKEKRKIMELTSSLKKEENHEIN